MKIPFSLILFVMFISLDVFAQKPTDSLSANSYEQKEIKATNHLKRELDQKQLSASPEKIADTVAQLETADKKRDKKRRPHCAAKKSL